MRYLMTIVVVCLLALSGCAGEVAESPLEGPGFDANSGAFTGEAGDYIVALTYLRVRNSPVPGRRFGELANASGSDLFESEPAGWLGASFRSEGRLAQYTMTVWASEEAMMDWVTGPVHTEAMNEIADVAVEAKSTTLTVSEADLPYSWDRAMEIYPTLDWYLHPSQR